MESFIGCETYLHFFHVINICYITFLFVCHKFAADKLLTEVFSYSFSAIMYEVFPDLVQCLAQRARFKCPYFPIYIKKYEAP